MSPHTLNHNVLMIKPLTNVVLTISVLFCLFVCVLVSRCLTRTNQKEVQAANGGARGRRRLIQNTKDP